MCSQKIISILFFILIFISVTAQFDDKKSIFSEKLSKKANMQLNDMVFIPMGSFNYSTYHDFQSPVKDFLFSVVT